MTEHADDRGAEHRETGTAATPAGDGRVVALRRTYPAPIEDVWDALTTADRIARWLTPVTGDLRPGGRYQLEGNAGGEILACEPPRLIRVSWVMGGQADGFGEVEARLTPVAAGTTVALRHTATVPPEFWERFGPGAVGVGWDMAALGLALHLAGRELSPEEKGAWPGSEEGRRRFVQTASAAWGAAHRAAGASPEAAASAAAATAAFYTPPAA